MTNFFGKVLRDPGATVPRPTRKPWWQTTKTARQGFILAAVWATLGLISGLVAHLWAMGVMWLALAGAYLASAAALRRREHTPDEHAALVRARPSARQPSDGPGRPGQ